VLVLATNPPEGHRFTEISPARVLSAFRKLECSTRAAATLKAYTLEIIWKQSRNWYRYFKDGVKHRPQNTLASVAKLKACS
jgi:hypothetical protein